MWVGVLGRLLGMVGSWAQAGEWVGTVGSYGLSLAWCRRLESCVAASTLTLAGRRRGRGGAGGIMLLA